MYYVLYRKTVDPFMYALLLSFVSKGSMYYRERNTLNNLKRYRTIRTTHELTRALTSTMLLETRGLHMCLENIVLYSAQSTKIADRTYKNYFSILCPNVTRGNNLQR